MKPRLARRTLHVSHPPIGTSRAPLSGRTTILLRLQTSRGFVFGEASPLPGYGNDSLERAEESLRLITAEGIGRAAQAAASSYADERQGVQRQADELPRAVEIASNFCEALESPAAQFCVEMLILGAAASLCEVPLFRLLTDGPVPSKLRTSAVLDPFSSQLQSEIQEQVDRGVRTFKVKCGRDRDRERAAVQMLSNWEGGDLRVRLDPNGAWSEQDAREFFEGCPASHAEWVEDITSGNDEWRGLRAALGVRLAIDEPLSLVSPKEQATLIETSGVDVVVVKPMVLGGFSRALRVVRAARRLEKSVCVSHLFDGPIALEACAQLAFAVQSPEAAAGLGLHRALSGYEDFSLAPSPSVGPEFLLWAGKGASSSDPALPLTALDEFVEDAGTHANPD